MSIVHSCDETQSAIRVSGGRPGNGSRRHAASPATASAVATLSGSSPSPGSRPCVASRRVTNSRNTTGSPSVTKYAAPGVPRDAPSISPSTTLSTCVVDVRCRPPPIQRNCPLRTASLSDGSTVVSPGPQTKRGRITTVSNATVWFACRTVCSAIAFVEGYSDGESGRSGALSSTFTSGSPASSAASVPTCTNLRTPAAALPVSAFWVPVTLPRMKSERGPQSPTCAAAWNVTAQPSAPFRIASALEMSPRTGSAPSPLTVASERSERARARTSQPALLRRWIRRLPMKPEPPVTKALSAMRRTLPARGHPEPDGPGGGPGVRDELVTARRQLARLEAQLVRTRLPGLGDGRDLLALAKNAELHLGRNREPVADRGALVDREPARLELQSGELDGRDRGRRRGRGGSRSRLGRRRGRGRRGGRGRGPRLLDGRLLGQQREVERPAAVHVVDLRTPVVGQEQTPCAVRIRVLEGLERAAVQALRRGRGEHVLAERLLRRAAAVAVARLVRAGHERLPELDRSGR